MTWLGWFITGWGGGYAPFPYKPHKVSQCMIQVHCCSCVLLRFLVPPFIFSTISTLTFGQFGAHGLLGNGDSAGPRTPTPPPPQGASGQRLGGGELVSKPEESPPPPC